MRAVNLGSGKDYLNLGYNLLITPNLDLYMGSYQKQKFSPQMKERHGEYIECETCKKIFYVTPARIRQVTKNGNIIRFCSMACYDKRGDKNPFWGKHHTEEVKQKFMENPNRYIFKKGKDNINTKRFDPLNFKGHSRWWWARRLLETVGKCEKCGNNDTRILLTHHLNYNRKNNCRENLILLCPNCHAILHYETKTGSWHRATKTSQRNAKRIDLMNGKTN